MAFTNSDGSSGYNGAHAQLLYRAHGSYSLVVDNVLHIATFAFFIPFVRHRSVYCSLTCTLIPPVVSLWKESHR